MITKICKDIETALKRKIQTPKDFDFLRECIYARLHVVVSSTTLKRVWGYLTDGGQPREHTLSVLAKFLGYNDWDDYQHNSVSAQQQQSNPVMGRKLNVPENLKCGDRLRLMWQPGRVCNVEYLGQLVFRVIGSENTRLKTGDTFQCSLIIEGEPLYIDQLVQGDRPPIAYVCGKQTGVMFEYPSSQ